MAHDETERIRSALAHLDHTDREIWVRAAMCIKSELSEAGYDVWDEWGSQYDKYSAGSARAVWRSVKEGGRTTIASLFYDARQAGWSEDKKYKRPSREEIERRNADAARRREQADREDAERHAAAAERANAIWDAAAECSQHPYLARKGVQSYGLRVGPWEVVDSETGEVRVVTKQALLVPIRDAGKRIYSLQAIFPGKSGSRDKDYLKDGAKSGLFYSFGKPQGTPPRILIGEGYATMASAHAATGHACIVAFDAGNLLSVGNILRERFPAAVLVFLADNDQFTEGNPGLTKANETAKAVGGLVALPPFAHSDAKKVCDGTRSRPTDFNDLHELCGLDCVRQVIEAAVVDGMRPARVVLVPTENEARTVEYAWECLTRLGEEIATRRGPAPVLNDTLVLAADGDLTRVAGITRMAYPEAQINILAAPGEEDEASRVAADYGARLEIPPRSDDGFDWGQHYLDLLFARVDAVADSDLDASELATAALIRAERVSAAPARDKERRRRQQEENKRIQETDVGAMIPSLLSVDEMVERCVWIAEGKNVGYVTEDRSMFLRFGDFQALTIESKTPIEVKRGEKTAVKLHPNADLWQDDKRRVSTMTVTFHPGASVITSNPKGLRAVNTWRPIQRWPAKADITPFIEQVAYLFQDEAEREVFLDWLAHIDQKPGELPHYGWLHIATNTGCGRNWVASVLARVFRGYVAPNVDLPALLDSPYNGELGGCVLGIVDEVREGAAEGNFRHAERLNQMINAETRTINNKYGMKYLEFNALRWLVFSNHKNALPLSDTDRRFRVVMHQAPQRSPEVYAHLYALLQDPEFINSVGVFLRERDISRFKPGERPPMNAAKLAAIAAAKPMSTQNAQEIVACWPADVIIYKHVAVLLTGDTEKREFPPALRRAMEEAGAETWHQGDRLKIKIGNSSHRVWVLRNHAKWLAESTDAIRKEISRAGVDDHGDRSAAVVLADAAEKMESLSEPPF